MKSLKKFILTLALSLCLLQAYAQRFNKKLAAQLASIYREDQHYRVAAISAAKIYGSYSKESNKLMKQQDSVDFINLVKVEKIISTHGYPGKSIVGLQSNVAFMVIQHNDLAVQVKYLPLFEMAAKKNELDRSLLPLMIDRVRTGKGQLQLFGTQLSEGRDNNIQIFPIEDEPNVNARRKAAGLSDLESYYKTYGINYILPTASANLNPKDLYVNLEQRSHSSIQAVGGDEAILKQLIYPEKARSNNITGFVTIGYIVDIDGKTKGFEIIKGLGYGCDEEAVRVITAAKYSNTTGEERELRMKLPFPYK